MPHMTRRAALIAAATPLAALAIRSARAETAGPFTLPALPYAPDANEPNIDTQTMVLHHDKHHAAYVNNLNNALKDYPQLAMLPLETILAKVGEIPDTTRGTIRNNAGGHANHSMFWQIMGGRGGAPSGALAEAITREFESLDKLKTQFNTAGMRQFGSGWVFVTVTSEGRLRLTTRPNQDTPLLEGDRVLFGNDVWEHAYYLKYQNRRADYLAAWWNVLDWTKIEARYDQARAGTLRI